MRELSTNEFIVFEELETQLFEDDGSLKKDASVLNLLRYFSLRPKYWISTRSQREGKTKSYESH